MKKTWRTVLALLLAMVLLIPAACAEEEAEPDYYTIGLKVTGLMNEIVNSEAYLSLMAIPSTYSETRLLADTDDYDRPVAVWKITNSDFREFIFRVFGEEKWKQWDNLSENLQNMLLDRMGIPTLFTLYNGRRGTQEVSFASIANAVLQSEELTREEAVYYLYIFEKGIPILVSFGYHGASGMFVFIPEEDRGSAESLRSLIPEIKLELEPVEIK